MSDARLAPQPADAPAADEAAMHPRSDFKDAVGWLALGLAVLIGSLAMDRLEHQHINPYTVPGLLPALLGIAMMLLGAVLGLRSWRRGALTQARPPASALVREERKRVAITVALCCGYGVVLLGHGIPFWLASSLYVTVSILVFQRLSHDPAERRLGLRAWTKALSIAVIASLVTWLVFERVFLVRLP